MNWLTRLLFPGTSKGIRIRPDHLPGLKAPKAAPFVPRLHKPEERSEDTIKALYKRFLEGGGSSAAKRNKRDRGVGF
jgi:hypothetical protein